MNTVRWIKGSNLKSNVFPSSNSLTLFFPPNNSQTTTTATTTSTSVSKKNFIPAKFENIVDHNGGGSFLQRRKDQST